MIYIIFSDYGQQNIFKKYVKPIFHYAKKLANLKDTHFLMYLNLLVLRVAKTKYQDRTPDKQNSPHYHFTNYYLNITHQHE